MIKPCRSLRCSDLRRASSVASSSLAVFVVPSLSAFFLSLHLGRTVFISPSPLRHLRRSLGGSLFCSESVTLWFSFITPSPWLWPSITCGGDPMASVESRYTWNFLLPRGSLLIYLLCSWLKFYVPVAYVLFFLTGDLGIAIEGCYLYVLSR